ncbi:hypothetical protein ACGFNU_15920 [Spirillospora sp. NPDC048911]|uniref:hypothetical protein n=1 Tax=Spirillospora sp. NPDC048911 TaxID=3364527 RepID=UPI0037214E12
MDGGLRFRKALMQADRGNPEAAKATLRNLTAELEPSPLQVRAMVVLGDLLSSASDHAAARAVLSEAVTLAESLDSDDLLAYEMTQARAILDRLP